ncbi:VC0807 family protein [Streptomyces sp. NPDC026673]|uniref:VC0807 family protein n=1 Tax=Streptomyces sp. NPDC026673 TaxID=3155724 RepID=UPI0033F16476
MSTTSRLSSALGWALTIGCNIVLPVVTYHQLTQAGWKEFPALLVSGVWPVLECAITLAWRRRIDEFAVITVAFLAVSAVAAVVITATGPHSARLLLVKDSAVTGLFGLLCLASLAAPRPLMFYFGRRFATDGSKEDAEVYNGMWRYEGFRRTLRVMTTVWGLGYVIEALTRIGLSYTLSTATMVTLNSVLSYAVLGALVVWTIRYGRRAAARGREQEAAAAEQGA